MHEIVTIQLGDFANHVGSHFWNLQVGDPPQARWTGGNFQAAISRYHVLPAG